MSKILQPWREQLRGVRLPRPFTVESFLACLADARGRRLTIETADLGCVASGLWLSYPDEDVVLVEATAPSGQRDAIVLHEVAHMLQDRPHDPIATAELRARLCPYVDLSRWDALVDAGLAARTAYFDRAEQDAERLARALGTLARLDRTVVGDVDLGASGVRARDRAWRTFG